MNALRLLITSGAFAVSLAALANAAAEQSLSSADKAFMMTASRGSVYELQLSKLAQSKAQDPKVKHYADMVVNDHATADKTFDRLAQKHDLTVPTALSQNDRTELDTVKKSSGSAFDRAYLQQMELINQEDVKSEQQEISSTRNKALKQFVEAMKDGDQKRSREAEELSKS